MLQIKEFDNAEALAQSFITWRTAEDNRRRKLLRKYTLILMNKTKVGYQQCFWRWTCAMAKFDWAQIFPKHLTFLKKITHVFARLKREVLYKAFVRISMGHQDSPERHVYA
jgi:hypothetical protein